MNIIQILDEIETRVLLVVFLLVIALAGGVIQEYLGKTGGQILAVVCGVCFAVFLLIRITYFLLPEKTNDETDDK